MSYIGNNLQVAYPSYTNIDDISGSFNGVTTSFALTVGGVAPVPAPLSSNQCMISVGGVIQRPDDTGTEGFRLSGGNIVFSSAPNTGEDFFGVILAGADYVNVGVNFPSGTASTPSITFDSDLDTGLYNPAANELGITTAGTSRLVVDSSGNVNIDSNTLYVDAVNNRVGVGTTSPQEMLTVGTSSAGGNLRMNSSSAGNNGLLRFYASDSAEKLQFYVSTTESVCYTPASIPLAFQVGGSERFRCDALGRLLVGTSSSINLISSPSVLESQVQIVGEGNNLNSGISLIHADNATNTSSKIVFARSGGTSAARTLPSDDTELGSIDFKLYDGASWQNSGRIYVTTKKPGSGDSPGRLFVQLTPDGTSSSVTRLEIDENGRTRMSGVYSLTTASAANVHIDFAYSLLRSTSSIKYKTNVETLENQYADAILNCRPVWYRSTSEADNKDWGWWGFIAEEVAEIDPRLVTWKTVEITYDVKGEPIETPCDPEPEGVQYDRFVPHLVNLMKRQMERIETLEAKVAALESA